MLDKMKKICLGTILIGMLLITSCKGGASKEPTPDVAAIQTEAVLEAMAQLTVDAVLSPTDTPVPATMTPLPTATVGVPTATKAVVYSGGSSSGSGGSSGTAVPTWTPDVYVCEVIDEYPLDGPWMTGWIDDKRWTVKNTGLVTWNRNEYYVKFIDDPSDFGLLGESVNFSGRTLYKLAYDVDPYETIDIIIDVQIPTQPVDHIQNSYWGIFNDNGDLFCTLPMTITLTYPAPTKTPNN